MNKESFHGVWKLVMSEYRLPDGQAIHPMGENTSGMLIYGADGHMMVQIMASGRPVFASGDRMAGTAEEIKTAFEGYVAYFGTYEVNQKEGSVLHRIEGSSFPNWVGKNQQRFYEISPESLILRTPPINLAGRQITGILHWKRLA